MKPGGDQAGTSMALTMNEVGMKKGVALKKIKKNWQLYLVILLPVIYVITFRYVPMYGVTIAFKDYIATKGITGSPWVGFKHFQFFFNSPILWRLITNTIGISVYSLIVGFPIPILLAVSINEVKSIHFKKTVQMVTYAPYFISTVVMVSILMQFLAPQTGLVNHIIKSLGMNPVNFMGVPQYFKSLYVWSGVWQHAGYSSIIYIAALSGIDPELHQSAVVDGANKLQRILNIDIPGIMPTAVILLILNMGQVMNVGFEKVYLMQNDLVMSASDVISTYVYRMGLLNSQFSYSTAVGLFNSVINLILLVSVNQIAKRLGETSLW